jgi:hypothetical protein
MLRHDWVYRWERVLTDAGLSSTTAMHERRQRLAELAGRVTPELLATGPAWGARRGTATIGVA